MATAATTLTLLERAGSPSRRQYLILLFILIIQGECQHSPWFSNSLCDAFSTLLLAGVVHFVLSCMMSIAAIRLFLEQPDISSTTHSLMRNTGRQLRRATYQCGLLSFYQMRTTHQCMCKVANGNSSLITSNRNKLTMCSSQRIWTILRSGGMRFFRKNSQRPKQQCQNTRVRRMQARVRNPAQVH